MVYSTCTSPVGQITFGVTNIFIAQFPFPYWRIAIYSISSSDCVVYDKNCNLYSLLIFHVLTERVIACNFPQLRKAATHKCASSNSQMRKQQLTNAQAATHKCASSKYSNSSDNNFGNTSSVGTSREFFAIVSAANASSILNRVTKPTAIGSYRHRYLLYNFPLNVFSRLSPRIRKSAAGRQ